MGKKVDLYVQKGWYGANEKKGEMWSVDYAAAEAKRKLAGEHQPTLAARYFHYLMKWETKDVGKNAIGQNESVEHLIYRMTEDNVVAGDLIGIVHGQIQRYYRQRVDQMLCSYSRCINDMIFFAEKEKMLTKCPALDGSVASNMLSFSTPAIMASIGRSGSPLRLASASLLFRAPGLQRLRRWRGTRLLPNLDFSRSRITDSQQHANTEMHENPAVCFYLYLALQS
jgi:hypothetical protein